MPERFTEAEMLRLAAKAVHKIDLLGARGTTLCTMEEIDAMACLLVLSGALQASPEDPRKGAVTAPSTPSSTGDDQ